MRIDRKRIIGTFKERKLVLECAERVLNAMEKSGHFVNSDIDSFRTTIISFLREPAGTLLGLCSYSNKHSSRNTSPGDRTWRILVARELVHRNDGELAATIYHEFLHGILGPLEGHGPTFEAFEKLWPLPMEV